MNSFIYYLQMIEQKDWACLLAIMFIVYVIVVFVTSKYLSNGEFKLVRSCNKTSKIT